MIDRLQTEDPTGFPAEISDEGAWAKRVCDRRYGIGGDGLIYLEAGETTAFRMRMYNPDGTVSEMCGNGLRCVARLLKAHGHTDAEEVPIETGAGLLRASFLDETRIRIAMGPAYLQRGEIGMTGPAEETFIAQELGGGLRGTAVSMGNPHVVIFSEDVARIDLAKMGPELEHHPLFPHRVNVHFVQVVDRRSLIQRTWERGAGITMACGTGACACGVAAFLNGHTEREVRIQLPGGPLEIEYRADGDVFMTGPAEVVYEGKLPFPA